MMWFFVNPLRRTFGWGLCLILLLCWCSTGCATVRPPIPPEDVGIEKKRLEAVQSEQAAADKKLKEAEEVVPIEEGNVEHPPLRPSGVRYR